MTTALLFDLDGTLVDSLADLHTATNLLLAEQRRPPIEVEQARLAVGHGAKALIAKIWRETGTPASEADLVTLHRDFLRLYAPIATDRTRPYPGVVAALEALAGHPMGVVTNKPEAPARRILAHLDLMRFFGAVVGGDTLPVRKPDPAPLRLAMRQLGAADAIMVGDSRTDVDAARNAGVPVVAVTWGYDRGELDADAVISRGEDLPGVVSRLIAR